MEETARRSEFKDDLSIDAPIPGQSLTAPLGDRPWQNPPEYVEVEDALEYYIPKVLDPDFSVELLDIIEMGIPLTTIANSLQLASVMEGKHSVDIGMLVMPVLVEMLSLIAENANVDYDMGISKKETKKVSDTKLGKIIQKMKEKASAEMEKTKKEEEVEEEPQEDLVLQGLMARIS